MGQPFRSATIQFVNRCSSLPSFLAEFVSRSQIRPQGVCRGHGESARSGGTSSFERLIVHLSFPPSTKSKAGRPGGELEFLLEIRRLARSSSYGDPMVSGIDWNDTGRNRRTVMPANSGWCYGSRRDQVADIWKETVTHRDRVDPARSPRASLFEPARRRYIFSDRP
jgi:hypothetical protein